MSRTSAAALVLSVLGGGWMILDGSVALVTGDYIGSEMGPWADLVAARGVDPLSLTMRLLFVLYGIAWLGAVAWYAQGSNAGRYALLFVAGGSLWYAIAGTVVAALVILFVMVRSWREIG